MAQELCDARNVSIILKETAIADCVTLMSL